MKVGELQEERRKRERETKDLREQNASREHKHAQWRAERMIGGFCASVEKCTCACCDARAAAADNELTRMVRPHLQGSCKREADAAAHLLTHLTCEPSGTLKMHVSL